MSIGLEIKRLLDEGHRVKSEAAGRVLWNGNMCAGRLL